MMTDEQLQQELQNVSGSLDKLSACDDPLTKQERRHQHILLLRKETLLKITQAREKGDKNREFTNLAMYGLLTSLGEKRPFLMHLVKSKFSTHI